MACAYIPPMYLAKINWQKTFSVNVWVWWQFDFTKYMSRIKRQYRIYLYLSSIDYVSFIFVQYGQGSPVRSVLSCTCGTNQFRITFWKYHHSRKMENWRQNWLPSIYNTLHAVYICLIQSDVPILVLNELCYYGYVLQPANMNIAHIMS